MNLTITLKSGAALRSTGGSVGLDARCTEWNAFIPVSKYVSIRSFVGLEEGEWKTFIRVPS